MFHVVIVGFFLYLMLTIFLMVFIRWKDAGLQAISASGNGNLPSSFSFAPTIPARTDLWYGHSMGTFGDSGVERQGNTMWEVDEPAVWRICLDGRVQEDRAKWFKWASLRCVVCPDGGWQTVTEGELRDRAALGGLISRMWEKSIGILSVDRIGDPTRRDETLAETIESWR